MKKKTTKKKETTLSILREIRNSIQAIECFIQYKEVSVPKENVRSSDEIIIDIPAGLTMQDIVNKCGNRTSKGDPLMYSISWYVNEKFYTEEKTRAKKIAFTKTLADETRSKTWHEQEEILKAKGIERLNAAEVLYILWYHEKETGERLLDYKGGKYSYYWTSSRASDGLLVDVGYFDSEGVRVGGWRPGADASSLGVCFSRSVS